MRNLIQHLANALSRPLVVLCATTLLLAPAAGALEVTVTVESLTPESGGVATPVWVAFQDGGFDLYDLGTAASPALERLAEDGNFDPLSADFLASGAGSVDGAVFGPDAPVFFSGQSSSTTFELDPTDPMQRYFTYASMVIPSNDAFVANGDPLAHPIFDGAGNFLGADFIVTGHQVRDAGTEVNDEVPANTAFFGQAAPDTGDTEGGVVMVHGGLQPAGSGGILDDAMFATADFTRPGYQVLHITVTAEARTVLRFPIAGDQEVPPVTSAASGICTVSLSADNSHLEVACEHNVTEPVAAHIHLGDMGENGDVVFDLGDATSPITATWALDADAVDALLAGGLYVNVHSTDNPAGELRGQIDGCFDGPLALCLSDRFQATARWEDFNGNEDAAVASALSSDSGTFYFFGPANVELLVKVIDGCDFNNRHWVFASGLTNLGVELTVEDTWTGATVTYTNTPGDDFAPILDNQAFATCP